MPKYLVTEKQAMWTYMTLEVAADNEDAAIEQFHRDVAAGAVSELEYGELFGDCSYEINEMSAEPPPPAIELVDRLLRIVGEYRGMLGTDDKETIRQIAEAYRKIRKLGEKHYEGEAVPGVGASPEGF